MRKPFRYYLPDYVFLLLIAGLILFLDQVTKELVRTRMDFSTFWVPIKSLDGYFRIVHWRNTGAAFGIFQDASLFFTILAIIVTVGILNFYPVIPRSDRFLRAAVALQLGGAMGNLLDRLVEGHVTDFIAVLSLPVFNIADLAIFVGVLLILVPILPQLRQEYEHSQLMQLARKANADRRLGPGRPGEDDQEAFTLGLVEVLFADTDFIRNFRLTQDVRRLRRGGAEPGRGMSRG